MKVKLVIGLGNPGKEYEKTYHNIGFLTVNFLTENIPYSKFLKSDVFMNQSGDFVKKTLKKYKIRPEELMIIHDDSDIELGKYKLSFGRASAGHNGVESIIQSLKTKNFWRLRIGIRKISNNSKRTKAGELVLRKISISDMKIFNILLPSLAHGFLSPLFSPVIQPPRPR